MQSLLEAVPRMENPALGGGSIWDSGKCCISLKRRIRECPSVPHGTIFARFLVAYAPVLPDGSGVNSASAFAVLDCCG